LLLSLTPSSSRTTFDLLHHQHQYFVTLHHQHQHEYFVTLDLQCNNERFSVASNILLPTRRTFEAPCITNSTVTRTSLRLWYNGNQGDRELRKVLRRVKDLVANEKYIRGALHNKFHSNEDPTATMSLAPLLLPLDPELSKTLVVDNVLHLM